MKIPMVTAATSTLLVALASLQAQQPTGGEDPSPHESRLVPVGQDLRLEVLDWGGNGTPLLLLPGGGDTAHVFDDFAPKLTNDFHVYGITRRGFGESGFAPLTSGADTFGDDVLAVLDALELASPVLVGRSIAGQERPRLGECAAAARMDRCREQRRNRENARPAALSRRVGPRNGSARQFSASIRRHPQSA